MIGALKGLDITTHVSSGLFEILTRRVLVRELAGVPQARLLQSWIPVMALA